MAVAAGEVMARWLLWLILASAAIRRVLANAEGDALNSLKSNLIDPNNVLQSWDPSLVNPCTWFHVTCSPDNHVIRVDLGNAQLAGALVPQLAQLTNLQYLPMTIYAEVDFSSLPYDKLKHSLFVGKGD